MAIKHWPKIFILTFFIFSAGTLAPAQTARPDFNRPQTYDVQHYLLRTNFDRPKRRVIGDATVQLKPLKDGFSQVELDAAGLVFNSVTLDPTGTPLKYKAAGERVTVTLDKAYGPNELISIRFKYSATPKRGVYFVEAETANGQTKHSAQIWTQGEADEAHHWFPSFDFPSDKATSEQYLTAKKEESVIANGELVDTKDNGDGTITVHYRMQQPHPTYLISFVIGKYAKVTEKYGEIPLGYYIYPGTESIVPHAYGKTRDMFRIFEELTGVKYPFNKYDQTIVASFQFGGMENITATTMADTEIFLAPNSLFKPGVEDLVSHELAHSWFGNLVTCKNWAELWLNEGFATLMEAVVREKLYGRRTYINKVMSDAESFIADDAVNPKRNALFNQNAGNIAELFDRPATIYNKGGAVLHTLREEIGDEAFWKGVNLYLTLHKFGSVETTDLINAMEEASGRDLDWFFDQWVYQGGHPKLTVAQVYSPGNKTLRLTITQTQKADKLTPAVFRLPLEVQIEGAGGAVNETIDLDKRVKVFTLKTNGRPKTLKIDPNKKVPVMAVKIAPLK